MTSFKDDPLCVTLSFICKRRASLYIVHEVLKVPSSVRWKPNLTFWQYCHIWICFISNEVYFELRFWEMCQNILTRRWMIAFRLKFGTWIACNFQIERKANYLTSYLLKPNCQRIPISVWNVNFVRNYWKFYRYVLFIAWLKWVMTFSNFDMHYLHIQ